VRKLWHVAGGLFLPLLAFFIPREALLITVGVVTGVFVAWEIARFVYPGVKRWTTSHLGIMLKREEHFNRREHFPACRITDYYFTV
jgi:hypothetical protein